MSKLENFFSMEPLKSGRPAEDKTINHSLSLSPPLQVPFLPLDIAFIHMAT